MIAEKISKRELRRFMAMHGLTGSEVARILDVLPQTVYCYMCGVRVMTRRQFCILQNAVWNAPQTDGKRRRRRDRPEPVPDIAPDTTRP